MWCGWRDLNPHALRRQNLNLVRLPISPHPHLLEGNRIIRRLARIASIFMHANMHRKFLPLLRLSAGAGIAAAALYRQDCDGWWDVAFPEPVHSGCRSENNIARSPTWGVGSR